jgi:putative peptidoglycan lipid II flippase
VNEELKVARNAGAVGAATMLSRVFGLMREQMMAILFGAGFATDAFNVAFRIPNLLRDLFAEGAMSSAFVPTFTEALHRRGEEDAWTLGRQLMTTLALILVALCALGAWLAPWLVRAFAAGFASVPGKLELTVTLTRIMLPLLPLVALAAVAMGMLNARGQFAIPALAPALMNLGMIVFGIALIPVCRMLGWPPILAMAFGVIIGGLLQFGTQLPPLLRLGFRFGRPWPIDHPGVARVARLMTPATIGLAATQINLLVSTQIASLLPQGSVSWLWYAFRLMQLPIGVFGVALATVSMPALARAAVENDLPALKRTLSATLRLVFLLTLPAALWMAVMSRPIIALLYEHGRFHAGDTQQSAGALVMYCVGLPAFAAVGVMTRTFYALGETRVPVQASFVSVALNLGLNLLFIGPLRGLGLAHTGLALATSLTAMVNFLQLSLYLRRRVGRFEGRRIATTLMRVALASLIAAGGCAAGLALLGERWHHGLVPTALVVLAGFAFALVSGYALMKWARVEELETVESLAASIAARLGWKGGRGGAA